MDSVRHVQVRDSGAVRMWRIAREPFTAATWRRTAYAVLALPVGLACIPLSLLGAPTARRQRNLARRFLGADIPGTARRGGLRHALLATPSTSSPCSSRSTAGRSSP
ncbi:hypothetical protein ACQ86D_15910 [Streptomyces galilaeus]